jgi:hypothetical protein
MERVYLLDLKCGWDFRSPETGIPHFYKGNSSSGTPISRFILKTSVY